MLEAVERLARMTRMTHRAVGFEETGIVSGVKVPGK